MPTIDIPNFWFALAAAGGLVLGFLVYLLGYFEGRDRAERAPDWIGMHAKARCGCRWCGGTGWTPIYEERALTRCPCTDATAIEELTAPISGRAL